MDWSPGKRCERVQTGNAVDMIQTFFSAYLVLRDVDKTLACLTKGVQWVGTGKSELVCGLDQVGQALREELAQTPDPYRIEYGRIEETAVSDTCAAVLLTASVWPPTAAAGGETAGSEGQTATGTGGAIWIRVSAVCVREEGGGWRIASIHASTPDDRQDEGEYFPAAPLSYSDLSRNVGAKSLDILGKSIPGGMMGG